jgi:hypothetical protein
MFGVGRPDTNEDKLSSQLRLSIMLYLRFRQTYQLTPQGNTADIAGEAPVR